MNKIPKKIHYCWFGGNDLPEKDKKCIDSWKKFCPDYEIIRWDESNYDITKNKYMFDAYSNKKWGFVPDYARFDIIFNEGGFYLDTDVELVKSLDDLRDNEGYLGFESGLFVNGGIGFGAVKGNKDIKMLRDMYDRFDFINKDGSLNLKPSPHYITEELEKIGLKRNGKLQKINSLIIYPIDFFAPKDYDTGKLKLTKNTVSIHQYRMSWVSDFDRKLHRKSQFYKKIFGLKFGETIFRFVSLPARVINKLKTGGISGFVSAIKRRFIK